MPLRPARILLLAAAIALLLCLATLARWSVSDPGGETWHFTFDTRSTTSLPTQNNIDLIFSRGLSFNLFTNHWTRWNIRQVTVPFWIVAVLTGLSAALFALLSQRATANTKGLCQTCGYDLRATPDRCPECGTIPQVKNANANGTSSAN
jgi:hypothetical protein